MAETIPLRYYKSVGKRPYDSERTEDMLTATLENTSTEFYTPAGAHYPRSWRVVIGEYQVQPGIFKWTATDPSGFTIVGYERSESMCREEARYAIEHAND